MSRTLFLMWYDDSPKLTATRKIEAAIEAYTERFHLQPNLVLLNESEQLDYPAITIRGVSTIARNNYWVGHERQESTESANHAIHHPQEVPGQVEQKPADNQSSRTEKRRPRQARNVQGPP